jgi:hypothetical protein
LQSDVADTGFEPSAALRRFHRVTTRLSASDVIELADRAGVPRRVGSQARKARRIGTESYLKLSNALGLDPCTGLPCSAAATPQARCHWSLLAAAVFFERSRRRLGVRGAAREIGLSTATLSRAENGNAIAIASALRLSAWLRLSPNVLFEFCPNNEAVTSCVTCETSPDDLVGASTCWRQPCP